MRALLDAFRKVHSPKTPSVAAPLIVTLPDRDVVVTVRRSRNARRLTLRIARDGASAIMTLPMRVGRAEAQRFAEKSADWQAKQLNRQPPRIDVIDGAEMPLRGEPHRLRLTGKARGLVLCDVAERVIHVPGQKPHVNRRLIDWLKQEARRDLTAATQHYAGAMGVAFSSVAIRDQKSRWGSCTAAGALSYSWRLILAPPYVLDYVAAHEVAHLREMNHSPRFWRLVLTHCKDTKRAKDWLKNNGRELHRLA